MAAEDTINTFIDNLYTYPDRYVNRFIGKYTYNSIKIGEALSTYFRMPIESNIIEIPTLYVSITEAFIVKPRPQFPSSSEIIVPIAANIDYKASYTYKKTLQSFFKDLNKKVNNRTIYEGFSLPVYYKDEPYFVDYGCLLDKNKTPLILTTLVANIQEDPEGYDIRYTSSNTYIHPSIFTTDCEVLKYIKNKIVPKIVGRNNPTSIPSRNIFIKDVKDKFIISPSTKGELNSDSINKFLNENIEELLDIMSL